MRRFMFILTSLIVLLSAQVAGAVTVFHSDTVTTSALKSLDHGYYYAWAINLSSLPEHAVITSASLVFDDMYDYKAESDDMVYAYLLDTLPKGGTKSGSTYKWSESSSNPGFSDISKLKDSSNKPLVYSQIGTWFDPEEQGSEWNYNKKGKVVYTGALNKQDVTLDFSASTVAALNDYLIADSLFYIGIDPDCHYYNNGVKLNYTYYIEPSDPQTVVPEPASLALLSLGLFGLGLGLRRKL